MAGLGKQFLMKLVVAWEELGKKSELVGDNLPELEMEEAPGATYMPVKETTSPGSTLMTPAQVKQEKVLLNCNTCGEAFRAAADLRKHEEKHRTEQDERKRKYFEKKRLEDLERKKIEEMEREKREAEMRRKKELKMKREELKAAAEEAERKRQEEEASRRKKEEEEERMRKEKEIMRKGGEEGKQNEEELKKKKEEEKESERMKVMAIFSGGKVNEEEFKARKRKAEEREALVERIKLARMMSATKEEKKEEVDNKEGGQNPIKFPCTKCGKVFKKNIELKMHIRRDHDPPKGALAIEHQTVEDPKVKQTPPLKAIQKEENKPKEAPNPITKALSPKKSNPNPSSSEKKGEEQPLTVTMIVATSPYFGQFSGLHKTKKETLYYCTQVKSSLERLGIHDICWRKR